MAELDGTLGTWENEFGPNTKNVLTDSSSHLGNFSAWAPPIFEISPFKAMQTPQRYLHPTFIFELKFTPLECILGVRYPRSLYLE